MERLNEQDLVVRRWTEALTTVLSDSPASQVHTGINSFTVGHVGIECIASACGLVCSIGLEARTHGLDTIGHCAVYADQRTTAIQGRLFQSLAINNNTFSL